MADIHAIGEHWAAGDSVEEAAQALGVSIEEIRSGYKQWDDYLDFYMSSNPDPS